MGEAEYFSHNRSIVRGQIIGNRRQLDGLYDFYSKWNSQQEKTAFFENINKWNVYK